MTDRTKGPENTVVVDYDAQVENKHRFIVLCDDVEMEDIGFNTITLADDYIELHRWDMGHPTLLPTMVPKRVQSQSTAAIFAPIMDQKAHRIEIHEPRGHFRISLVLTQIRTEIRPEKGVNPWTVIEGRTVEITFIPGETKFPKPLYANS